MKNKELATKSLMLSTEFNLYVVEHPEVADKIPRGAVVVLLPEDDSELAEYNLEIAEINREPGQPMVLVRNGSWLCSQRCVKFEGEDSREDRLKRYGL